MKHFARVVFVTTLVIVAKLSYGSRELFLNKLVNCKGFENFTLNWSDVTLERDPTTKDFSFSLKLKALKEVSAKFSMVFDLWKCDLGASSDDCEYFLKQYRNNEICALIGKKRQFWTVFVDRFDPPLVCPIKPGTYNIRKVPFKSDFLRLLPVKSALWKVRIKGLDQDQTISCVEIELRIVNDNNKRQG